MEVRIAAGRANVAGGEAGWVFMVGGVEMQKEIRTDRLGNKMIVKPSHFPRLPQATG
jgi:hypothetical protein